MMRKIMHVIKQRTNTVKPLAEMGARLIGELRAEIETEFLEDFSLVKSEKTSLLISYLGYPIIIRVEIELKRNGESWSAPARLVAYSVDRNTPPEETEIIAYEFDKLGNVAGRFTPSEFGANFLFDVFNSAGEKGMVLRPN